MDEEHEVVEAFRQILIQLYGLCGISRLRPGIGKVVRETIFFLYEGGNAEKWSFERPHSAAARALHHDAHSNGVAFNGKTFPVVYDHAIPLNTLGDGLREATASVEKLHSFLIRHIQGVVITKDENAELSRLGLRRRLPPDAQAHELLARYRYAAVKLETEDEAKLELRAQTAVETGDL
jgi:hypothetical protein